MFVVGPTFFSRRELATFLLRYDDVTHNQWEDVITGAANFQITDTYTASIGKVELDTTETIGGLSTAKCNYGVTTRAGSWDYGGCFPTPEWPTTGDFSCDFYLLPKAGMGSGTTDPRKGGWLYNSGGLGHASAGNIDKTNFRNKGAYSLFLDTDLSLQFSQGDGQDTADDPDRITLSSSADVIVEGVWNYIAMVREGGVWSIYAGEYGDIADRVMTGTELHDSTAQANSTFGSMWCQNRASPLLGAFVGHLAEYRTFNRAIYSGPSFPVPAAPLSNIYPS